MKMRPTLFAASVAPIKAMLFGSINVRRSGRRSATALGTDKGLGFAKSPIMTKSLGDFASSSHINRARCFDLDRRSGGRLDSFPKENAGPEPVVPSQLAAVAVRLRSFLSPNPTEPWRTSARRRLPLSSSRRSEPGKRGLRRKWRRLPTSTPPRQPEVKTFIAAVRQKAASADKIGV